MINKNGIILLQDKKSHLPDKHNIMKGWGRLFGYHSISQTRSSADFAASKKRRKYHNQGIRKQIRYLKKLLNSNDDLIICQAGDYSIQSQLDDSQIHLITQNQRSEVYTPLAFKKKDHLVGGIYANLWHCGSNEESKKVISVGEKPITSVVSAICMFGYNLKGIDNKGCEHPLTNTAYRIPEGRTIVKVVHKNKNFHPYEKLMLQTYQNLLPFFYVMGQGHMPKLFQQIPHAEYVFYGLNLFLKRKMSSDAFYCYINILEEYHLKHKQAIYHFCQNNNMMLDLTGPMDTLVFGEKEKKFSLHDFFNRIDLESSTHISTDKSSSSEQMTIIVNHCLDWLSDYAHSPYKDIWDIIKQQKNNGNIQNHILHGNESLLALNYLSYIVKVASAAILTEKGQVCLSHFYREKPIALAYKALLAERFGSIIALYWMIPVFSNISEDHSIYYMDTGLQALNELLEEGIADTCFIETGKIALSDQAVF